MNKVIALTAGLFIPFFIRPILADNGFGPEVIVPMLLGAIACGIGLMVVLGKEIEEA